MNIAAPIATQGLTPNSRLLRLIGLAHEASPAKRHELLLQITDVFFETAPELSDRERDIFCLIIAQLAQTSPPPERRALGAKLATLPGISHSLLQDLGPSEGELIALLRAGKAQAFVSAFARALEYPLEDTEALFANPANGVLAEACRRAGLSRPTYSAIVLLSDPLRLRGMPETENLLMLYAPPLPVMDAQHAA